VSLLYCVSSVFCFHICFILLLYGLVSLTHIKGKENKVVDALSRRVHELHATTISMYQSDLKHIILEVAKLDLQYKELEAKLQQGILQ
jgi:hypothetical protein